MFCCFGSQVTILQRGANLLACEDADVAAEVANIMREDGIEVLLETKPVRVEQSAPGTIQLPIRCPKAFGLHS